jgi:hypothetical protein
MALGGLDPEPRREAAGIQVGGFNTPASQPRMPASIGSLDTAVVSIRPHFWHSNVWWSKPDGPASSFDSSIRFRLHVGQRGRSIAESSTDATG